MFSNYTYRKIARAKKCLGLLLTFFLVHFLHFIVPNIFHIVSLCARAQLYSAVPYTGGTGVPPAYLLNGLGAK